MQAGKYWRAFTNLVSVLAKNRYEDFTQKDSYHVGAKDLIYSIPACLQAFSTSAAVDHQRKR